MQNRLVLVAYTICLFSAFSLQTRTQLSSTRVKQNPPFSRLHLGFNPKSSLKNSVGHIVCYYKAYLVHLYRNSLVHLGFSLQYDRDG